jgi:trehalose/maltose hydrolase-like predicted phosphorylase
MRRISRRLFVPFVHGDVIEQFEGYSRLREFDFKTFGRSKADVRRMDNLLQALGDDVNRYQISKQGDVLMLFYLFSHDELRAVFEQLGYSVTPSIARNNLDYYAPRTVGGSTLSRIVSAWVQSRLDGSHSLQHARETLLTDVCQFNASSTTAEGIQLGAMAGAVDIFQRCYLGASIRDDLLWFEPNLPDELSSVSMFMRYRGTGLGVRVSHDALEFDVADHGPDCHVRVRGAVVSLRAGEKVRVALEQASGRRRES